jgi:hypothetical protein
LIGIGYAIGIIGNFTMIQRQITGLVPPNAAGGIFDNAVIKCRVSAIIDFEAIPGTAIGLESNLLAVGTAGGNGSVDGEFFAGIDLDQGSG